MPNPQSLAFCPCCGEPRLLLTSLAKPWRYECSLCRFSMFVEKFAVPVGMV